MALDLGFKVDAGGTALPQGAALDRGAYERASVGSTSVTYVSDPFTRTVAGGWGSPDTGGAYSLAGPASDFSVDGAVGSIRLPVAGAGRAALLPAVDARDIDTRFKIRTDRVATGRGQTVYFVARQVTDVGEYRLTIRFVAGSIYVRGVKCLVGKCTPLSAETRLTTTHSAGTFYAVRAQVVGADPTALRLKVWTAGQPEPATWQYSASDSAVGLQVPGASGVRTWIAEDATNAPVRFSFDDWSVTSP
jgi:hypothetical protein